MKCEWSVLLSYLELRTGFLATSCTIAVDLTTYACYFDAGQCIHWPMHVHDWGRMHAYFFPVLFGTILTVRSDTRPKAAKSAFYAVAAGRKPGIYRTWPEAESQVRGFGGYVHHIQSNLRARYKKFNTESEARSFVGTGAPGPSGSSKPYQRPGTNASDRATSPISYAESSDLPPNLKAIAKDGFRFSSGQPPRLVAYTDGSGLGNGKRGARAGAGVYWGDGKAALHNIAERVPGKEQTNNRGELLVSSMSWVQLTQSIIRAIEMCPHPQLPLEIRTDSQYSISCERYAGLANIRHDSLPP